jgi:uncharacterized protein YqeY
MSLSEQIQKDIVTAMKARDEHRLSTLRMVKTALKNREVEKMAPLDDKESQQVLSNSLKADVRKWPTKRPRKSS